ncbi:hypothetical protein HYV83_02775 [Candidatus Woesearchaeota archaeon]|nr:hypothetical protein [Candidatus Woesearchaeota archaeon]
MDLSESQIREWMERCITLAKKAEEGVGYPHVGALVLDASGRVIGEGYKTWLKDSDRYLVHAERSAIINVTSVTSLRKATLVTTLEPCVSVRGHHVFMPCSQLIVESGISRVIIGITDDSPSITSGKGIGYLERRKVEVIMYMGLEERIAMELMPRRYKDEYFQTSIRQKSEP